MGTIDDKGKHAVKQTYETTVGRSDEHFISTTDNAPLLWIMISTIGEKQKGNNCDVAEYRNETCIKLLEETNTQLGILIFLC